jgi:hypothetical protein
MVASDTGTLLPTFGKISHLVVTPLTARWFGSADTADGLLAEPLDRWRVHFEDGIICRLSPPRPPSILITQERPQFTDRGASDSRAVMPLQLIREEAIALFPESGRRIEV